MPDQHTVRSYEEELRLLDKKIAQMGGIAELQLGQAIDALEARDPALADQVISKDAQVDALQRDIEEQVITMIARRQPMADDLRHILGAIRIASDLERVGDLAKNIAKRTLAISSENLPKTLLYGLKHMAELAQRQLKDVLDAYADRNSDAARLVWTRDEQIDATYNSVFRELLTYMMEDPRNIGLCTHLLFGAKNLERIGDHTTNIAETVHYLVKGTTLAENRPKGDKTSSTLLP